MPRANETRHIKLRKNGKFKCRLNASACNNKQRWNKYECKELIDEGICEERVIWNTSNCECECDKSCDVGNYLDYQNC